MPITVNGDPWQSFRASSPEVVDSDAVCTDISERLIEIDRKPNFIKY